MDENKDNVPETNVTSTEVVPSDFCILVTQEDKFGTDISRMSNFFDGYIQQLSIEIKNNGALDVIADVPISDIGILGEVVQHAKAISAGEFSLLPDFDHLPSEVREKLQKGLFTVGESRQVDGNLRAVILDEEGVRVKDITLKKVRNDPGTLATTRSIGMQLQMRQLAAKLDEIQEMEQYQIDRDRDRDIITPFLTARDFILQAQNQSSQEERKRLLQEASKQLTLATNAVYTDLRTSSQHLAKLTGRPIFRNAKLINAYMGYLAEDIQVVTKFTGVHMHVLDYLGDHTSAQLIASGYQQALDDFFTQKLGKKGLSASMLLQMNFPYTAENRDSWYYLQKEMIPVLESKNLLQADKPIYMVSVEEENNGAE